MNRVYARRILLAHLHDVFESEHIGEELPDDDDGNDGVMEEINLLLDKVNDILNEDRSLDPIEQLDLITRLHAEVTDLIMDDVGVKVLRKDYFHTNIVCHWYHSGRFLRAVREHFEPYGLSASYGEDSMYRINLVKRPSNKELTGVIIDAVNGYFDHRDKEFKRIGYVHEDTLMKEQALDKHLKKHRGLI
jgi:hypothetical protein